MTTTMMTMIITMTMTDFIAQEQNERERERINRGKTSKKVFTSKMNDTKAEKDSIS